MLAAPIRGDEHDILEGSARCPDPECAARYPIIDGIPILLVNLRDYLSAYGSLILQREDLAAESLDVLGEALGQGSAFDLARQYTSSYGWDAYGDYADQELDTSLHTRMLLARLQGSQPPPTIPQPEHTLEFGCAAGRCTFEVAAQTNGLVLGCDLNFPLLRIARRVLETGVARFPLKRSGLRYDTLTCPTPFGEIDNVDFWVVDACAPAFADATVDRILGFNLLDAVQEPAAFLDQSARLLAADGELWLSTPFEWTGDVTPMDNWLGGTRAIGNDNPVDAVKRWLTAPPRPMHCVWEADGARWATRVSERATTVYDTWLARIAVGSAPTSSGAAE